MLGGLYCNSLFDSYDHYTLVKVKIFRLSAVFHFDIIPTGVSLTVFKFPRLTGRFHKFPFL